ncbi:hypothetical protein JCM8097_005443 [Rhodosporidiobolus ruineniae]
MWHLGPEGKGLLICALLPPLAVYRKRGMGIDFWLAVELTTLAWIPGAMMAVFVYYRDVPPAGTSDDNEPEDAFDSSALDFSSSDSDMEKEPLAPRSDPVLAHALKLPVFDKLRNSHFVLASASPRRREILATYGLEPVIVPSTFPETLSHADFDDPAQYAVATGSAKAVEVYEKLVRDAPDDPPDLVIGADTVVILPGAEPVILEKPLNKEDQLKMLEGYGGREVVVATGVTVVQPQLATPGYSVSSLVVETKVRFAENSAELLQSYVDCGEGIDRAGGFAIQGLGGLLIRSIDGDYNNCVGFPGQAFIEWLSKMEAEGDLLAMD